MKSTSAYTTHTHIMGRIITFAAPKYHTSSRAASPEAAQLDNIAPENHISRPKYTRRPSSPVSFNSNCSTKVRQSNNRADRKTKTVKFSELPPIICEIPYWDRSPFIPSPEDMENARDDSEGDTDDDLLSAVSNIAISRRHSSATSLEQATKWARRLSV